MKTYRLLCPFLIFMLFFLSCAKKVTVSTDDNIPPTTSISVIEHGRITTITSDETRGKSVEVLEDTTKIVFIASGKDSLGIKSLTVEVTQNGSLEVKDRLYPSYTKNAPEIDSLGQGVDGVFLVGNLHPDSYEKEMVIKGHSEDYANNTSLTPALRLQFVKKAVGRISASRNTINKDERVTLHYESDNANRVSINDEEQSTLNGSLTVSPSQTTTYTLKAENSLSFSMDSVRISVVQPPNAPSIHSFFASPATVTHGNSSTLRWEVSDASSIRIPEIGFTSNNASGSKTVTPTSATTYTLTATGPGGSVSRSARVKVNPPASSIQCFTTPASLVSFNYVGRAADGIYYYGMNLSGLAAYNRVAITKITNKSNVRVALWTGGENVIINPNQSTDKFNGLNIMRAWTIQSEQFIVSPQIEFCYKSL